MISKHQYKILYLLNLFGTLDLPTLTLLTNQTTSSTAARMLGLVRRELIYADGNGYNLTEGGEDELALAFDDPSLTSSAKAWIARARCGIDGNGHQSKLERAVCPTRIEPMDYYTVDMEGMIDLMREELSEYDD